MQISGATEGFGGGSCPTCNTPPRLVHLVLRGGAFGAHRLCGAFAPACTQYSGCTYGRIANGHKESSASQINARFYTGSTPKAQSKSGPAGQPPAGPRGRGTPRGPYALFRIQTIRQSRSKSDVRPDHTRYTGYTPDRSFIIWGVGVPSQHMPGRLPAGGRAAAA